MDPYTRAHLNTIRRLQRTTPYYKKESRRCMYRSKEECFTGVHCPLHGNPSKARELLLQTQKRMEEDPYYHNDFVPAVQLPSLGPPDDSSIKTIYVGGIDERIIEQDLRVNFFAHGEIETIEMLFPQKLALVTYKTREGAEKAGEELSNQLVIKGLRLKLMWHRPPPPKPEYEASDEARQQAVVQSGLMPRPVISQQKNHVLQPPGFKDQALELPPSQQRGDYPSLDPQTMGALISSPEGSSSGSNDINSD